MNRRERILREMELAPLWRLRRTTSSLPEGGRVERVPDGIPPPRGSGDSTRQFPPPVNAPSVGRREYMIRSMDWPALELAVKGCVACPLHSSRHQAVFGVGDQAAAWMLVGEAPGAEEDRLGEPFVGQAGRLLDAMLSALDLRRGENVYIANVLKCRPPGNRNPDPQEVARCSPHLERQIALVKPKLLVAMGRFAAQTLLGSDASIASLRGKVHRYAPASDPAGLPLIVTYHPAYLLRNLPDKAKAWEDLLFARRTFLARSITG